MLNSLKEEMNVNNLSVSNRLDVDGIAFLNRLKTSSIDVGSIKIENNSLMFSNGSTRLLIGKEVVTIQDLENMLTSFKSLQNLCGEDFSKCQPITEEYLKSQEKKEVFDFKVE